MVGEADGRERRGAAAPPGGAGATAQAGGRDEQDRREEAPALVHEAVDPEELRCAVLDEEPREHGRAGHREVAARRAGSRVASDRRRGRDEHERVERDDREPAVPDAAEADDGRR